MKCLTSMRKTMTTDRVDYSDRLCDLYPSSGTNSAAWPMYSFSRPAYKFWNGFANGLRERGLTDEQIKDQLQSKGVRWMLDNRAEELEELGRKMAAAYTLWNYA